MHGAFGNGTTKCQFSSDVWSAIAWPPSTVFLRLSPRAITRLWFRFLGNCLRLAKLSSPSPPILLMIIMMITTTMMIIYIMSMIMMFIMVVCIMTAIIE